MLRRTSTSSVYTRRSEAYVGGNEAQGRGSGRSVNHVAKTLQLPAPNRVSREPPSFTANVPSSHDEISDSTVTSVQNLQMELAKWKSKYTNQDAELVRLRAELDRQIRDGETKVRELEQQRQADKTDFDRLFKEKNALSEQLTQLRSDHELEVQRLKAQHDSEVDGLRGKHVADSKVLEKNSTEKLEQLQREHDKKAKIAQETHKLLDGMKNERDQLHTEKQDQKQKDLELLKEKEAQLKAAASIIEENNARIRDLESSLDAMRAREQASISREKNTATRLKAQVMNEQRMQEQLNIAKKERAEMSRKLQDVEAVKEKEFRREITKSVRGHHTQLQSKEEESKSEIRGLKSKITELQKENTCLKKTNQTFENRLQNFEERTKANRKECDTLKDSLESSKSKIKNLEERILAEQKATAKANRCYQLKDAELHSVRDEFSKEKEFLTAKVKKLKDDNTNLTKEVQKKKNDFEALRESSATEKDRALQELKKSHQADMSKKEQEYGAKIVENNERNTRVILHSLNPLFNS